MSQFHSRRSATTQRVDRPDVIPALFLIDDHKPRAVPTEAACMAALVAIANRIELS